MIVNFLLNQLANYWMYIVGVVFAIVLVVRAMWFVSNPKDAYSKTTMAVKRWWREGVIVVLVLTVAAGALRTFNIKQQYEDRLASLTHANTILQSNNAKLEQSISSTNAAIDRFTTYTKDAKQQFQKLETTVARNNAATGAKLDAIRKEAKPLTCDDAIQYLIAASKEYPR